MLPVLLLVLFAIATATAIAAAAELPPLLLLLLLLLLRLLVLLLVLLYGGDWIAIVRSRKCVWICSCCGGCGGNGCYVLFLLLPLLRITKPGKEGDVTAQVRFIAYVWSRRVPPGGSNTAATRCVGNEKLSSVKSTQSSQSMFFSLLCTIYINKTVSR